MIKDIREDIIKFISDKYIDDSMSVKDGDDFFNSGLCQDDRISTFSLGKFESIPRNFLLVQCKEISADSLKFSTIGSYQWGGAMTISIYIEKNTTPINASYISDMYMEKLSEALQLFSHKYKKHVLISPSLKINKYYETKDESVSLTGITKIIINADFTFGYKNF